HWRPARCSTNAVGHEAVGVPSPAGLDTSRYAPFPASTRPAFSDARRRWAGDRTGVALSSGWVLLSRAKNLSIACGEVINLLPTRSASSLTSTPEPVRTPTKCHRRPVAEWIVPVDG